MLIYSRRFEDLQFIEDENLEVVLGGRAITSNDPTTHIQVCFFDENICEKTGDMPLPLMNFSVVDLKNGNHELMLLGGSYEGIYNNVYIINYLTGAWRETGSMATARTDSPAETLSDGKVIVAFGGDLHAGSAYEIWDHETEEFFFFGEADCQKESLVLIKVNGLIYAVGGDEKILVFNEETYVWDLVSEFDFRWSYFGSSITQDDKLLLSVGNQFNPYVPYTEIAAIIDLDTGEITMIDSVNFNGLYPAQFCADNGICYKAGGFNVNNGFDLNTVEAYEDSTWIPYEPMPIDCANPLVAEMSDGRYFVTCDNRLDNGANLIFSWNSEPEIDWHETFFNGENYEVQISASDIDEDSIAVRLWFQGGPTEWSELQPSGTTFEFIADHAWGLLMTQVHDQWYNDGIHNSISDFEVIAELALDDIHHPSEFYLSQNYPNPFNPITRIDYYLLKYGLAELNIYNLSGGLVTTLVYERQSGHQSVMWQVEDYPSGHYLYRLLFDGHVVEEKKMVVVK